MCKLFGAGIILATAYVHMFMSSVAALSSPCIDPFFQSYTAFPAVFTLFGIFTIHLIQILAFQLKRGHNHSHDLSELQRHNHEMSSQETLQNINLDASPVSETTLTGSYKTQHADIDHNTSLFQFDNENQLMVLLLELGIASVRN